MSEAVTPAAGAQAPAPAAPPASPSPSVETVTLTKQEHEQLRRDAARASSAQQQLDRIKAAGTRSNGRFNPPAPAKSQEKAEEPTEADSMIEDRKAERGLMALAADPAYREVLDADPTLRTLLTTNPLGVLPLLAPDAFDAEDALGLVRGKLDERAQAVKKPAPVAETPKPNAPPAPPAGGINAPSADVNEKYEAAKKLPSTESAIAGMVNAKLKFPGRT